MEGSPAAVPTWPIHNPGKEFSLWKSTWPSNKEYHIVLR